MSRIICGAQGDVTRGTRVTRGDQAWWDHGRRHQRPMRGREWGALTNQRAPGSDIRESLTRDLWRWQQSWWAPGCDCDCDGCDIVTVRRGTPEVRGLAGIWKIFKINKWNEHVTHSYWSIHSLKLFSRNVGHKIRFRILWRNNSYICFGFYSEL